MRSWFANKWENLRASLWFLPGVIVTLCILLALATLRGDEHLNARNSEAIPYLFSGTADAARTMLSTIASSLLTVLSIAFSLTMVALQQASSQFSPRVLRSITSSRVNQGVVGVYAGTYIYALLILRTIRGEHAAAPFVPALSVTSAVLLALLCIAMLVYFIHHVSLSLQVSEVIDRLHRQLLEQLEQLYPEPLSADEEPVECMPLDELPECKRSVVRAREGGFVRRIDGQLSELEAENTTIWLTVKVGEYVPRGGVLASVAPANSELEERVRSAYIIDSERSYAHDPLFAVRQLVDIGLRALSPGVNDPTTAEYVLRHLGDGLAVLVGRKFPPRAREEKLGRVRLFTERLDWHAFVAGAFGQIRRASRGDVDVTRCLLEVLRALGEQTTCERRATAIRTQVTEIQLVLAEQGFSDVDRQELSRLCESALHPLLPSALRARARVGELAARPAS